MLVQPQWLKFNSIATMAKVTSLLGGLRGKASNMVFAKTGGSVIMREYNPTVSNPNTEAQVNNRTAFKLLSQLSAAMADVIAIPKDGLKSGRNIFQSINSKLTYTQNGVAQIIYENIQLTNSNTGLPGIYAKRSSADGSYIELSESAAAQIDRVIYAVFKKDTEEVMQLLFSAISSIPGDDRKFRISGFTLQGEVIIYAYGMRDLNAQASAKYGNYYVENATDLAKLISDRSIATTDYKFTKTRGTTLFAGEDETTVVPDGYARVYVTAGEGGSVSGAGVFELGSEVTVVATAGTGYTFEGWYDAGNLSTRLSANASYTFTLNGTADLVAKFAQAVAGVHHLTLDKLSGIDSVTGAGDYQAGTSVTVSASFDDENYTFGGWYDGSTLVSSANPYTFSMPDNDLTLTAEINLHFGD